ncbi:unnamed protein product, partial [Heterosigma akashiwo]
MLSEDAVELLVSVDISPPFKNLPSILSDAVKVAEIVFKQYPKLVELHNYNKTSNTSQKLDNWETLNRKVLSRLRAPLP